MMRLRTNLIAAFVLVLLIPTTIIGVYTVNTISQATLEKYQTAKLREVSDKVDEMEGAFFDLQSSFVFLGQAPATKAYAGAVEAGVAGDDGRARYLDFLRQFLEGSSYRAVTVLSLSNSELIHAENVLGLQGDRPASPVEREMDGRLFRQAVNLSPGAFFVSRLELVGDQDEGPVTAVAVYASPLYAADGTKAGVILAQADVSRLMHAAQSTDAGEVTLIVDADTGEYLLHPDESKKFGTIFGTGQSLYADYVNDAGVILAQRQDRGMVVGSEDNPNDLQVFAAVSPPGHDNIRWVLIYQYPLSKLFQKVDEARLVISFLVLAAALFAAAVAFLFTRSIVAPIQRLAVAARALSRGEWDAPLATVGGLVPSAEIKDMTVAFVQMRENIKKSHAELKKYSGRLEQQVAERTAELSRGIDELARMNKLMVGREMKMIELKKRIADLEKLANEGGDHA